MGLWEGYDELVGLNQTAALNVILFFTDGKPTGVNVNMPLVSATTCTNAHPGPPQWINGLYNTYTNANQYFGIVQPTNNGTIMNNDGNATSDANNGCRLPIHDKLANYSDDVHRLPGRASNRRIWR